MRGPAIEKWRDVIIGAILGLQINLPQVVPLTRFP